DVPDGAAVSVSGHTDSVIGAVDNQELSENRAEAVAEVIEAARDDLDLQVAGFADTQPAETEDPEDPSTFAANRRVDIVYSGRPARTHREASSRDRQRSGTHGSGPCHRRRRRARRWERRWNASAP